MYATVSRGYKAGGFNLSDAMLPSQIQFNPESDLNFEMGYKAELLEHSLRVNTDVFYMRRKSLQVKTSEQLDPSNPGHVHAVHGQCRQRIQLRPGERSAVAGDPDARRSAASLGLLQTRYHGFIQDGAAVARSCVAECADRGRRLSARPIAIRAGRLRAWM